MAKRKYWRYGKHGGESLVINRFLKGECIRKCSGKASFGQGLVEYLILVCLIAVASIAIVSVVGKNIREQYANISAALRNEKQVKVTAPDRNSYESRGMDDFAESGRTGR